MKNFLVPFAVGAGIIYATNYAASYLTTPGSDGKAVVSAANAQMAAAAVGGIFLVIAHHVTKSA